MRNLFKQDNKKNESSNELKNILEKSKLNYYLSVNEINNDFKKNNNLKKSILKFENLLEKNPEMQPEKLINAIEKLFEKVESEIEKNFLKILLRIANGFWPKI